MKAPKKKLGTPKPKHGAVLNLPDYERVLSSREVKVRAVDGGVEIKLGYMAASALLTVCYYIGGEPKGPRGVFSDGGLVDQLEKLGRTSIRQRNTWLAKNAHHSIFFADGVWDKLSGREGR